MDAVRAAAAGRVEKGVTGKEKLFQQSREFGPGPIKPYLPSSQPSPTPDLHNRPTNNLNRRVSNGVYRGPSPSKSRAV